MAKSGYRPLWSDCRNGSLQIIGIEDVYAVGDIALLNGKNGQPLPGFAPVAKQQGKYVAHHILAAENSSVKPFNYLDGGIQVTIGRDAAIFQYGHQAHRSVGLVGVEHGPYLFLDDRQI